MWLEPFPLLRASQAAALVPALAEYVDDVEHHLRTAGRAAERTGRRVEDTQLLITAEGQVTLLTFYAAGIAEAGDMAIRAAVSAVEMGLQVTNLVLDLGLPKKAVTAGKVKAALKNGGPIYASLLAELDALFSSIGWELFLAYRHWVTHRGAPIVLAPRALLPTEIAIPLPLPDDPPHEQVHREIMFAAVNRYVLDNSEVVCWPFVPPVHGILDDEHGTPVAKDVGISLPPDSKLKLIQNRVSVGSLREDARSYRAKNPVLLGRGSARRADESLQHYAAHDYVHAVHEVVRFAEEALRGGWDGLIRDMWQRRQTGLV
jgi:hypothetical protein